MWLFHLGYRCENKIPFIYISLSYAAPCLSVLVSSVSPYPTEMIKGSVIDARAWYTLPQTSLGAFHEGTNYFLSCFSSKILQQIKPVCLCIVFYIISGQQSLLMCYFPFVPVLLTVGQHVAISTAVAKFHVCFLISLHIFPFCGTSLATFLFKLFLFFIILLWHLPKDVARSRF